MADVVDSIGNGCVYFDWQDHRRLRAGGQMQDRPAASPTLHPDNAINDWLVEQIKTRYGEPPDLFDGTAA
ncbi:MAG: hypothetical protein H6649_08080 [Caldilineae bacterium]|nr:hypothetical protein [Caldilineae bacterium]